MYLAIDIGGTKTLLGTFSEQGELLQTLKFPTPQNYHDFIRELANNVEDITTNKPRMAGVALPGRIDRKKGIGIACGNLPWRNVPIQNDIEKILGCPVIVENDAKLAALSEAQLVQKKYSRVLYDTISTGIGMGVVVDGRIDPDFQDSEGGEIILEHEGKLQMWEKFASGHAIVQRYGQEARQISDPAIWDAIARNISIGLIDLCAIVQPQIIILGGGVGEHYEKFQLPLNKYMEQFATPLNPLPALAQAQRPEQAVIYGCFLIAKNE